MVTSPQMYDNEVDSNYSPQDSMMQGNLTKPKAGRNSQEKEELMKKYYKLAEEIKNKRNGSTVIYTPYKMVRTPKVESQGRYKCEKNSNVKSQSEVSTSSCTAIPYDSAQEVNLCNDTLEQNEQISQVDSGLPQIDNETTADVNLASSLSESQSTFPEPQEEPKPNEINRRHVYSSPLIILETNRDKQASTKGITETHDKSHVMSLAETQEVKEACNKQASTLETTETRDEGHVMNPAETQEEEACNSLAIESTEKHDEEACNNQALESAEKHAEGPFVSSAAKSQEICNKQDSGMESTETHENHAMGPAEAQKEEACNNQALGSTEKHDEEVCNNLALENTETHDDGPVMSSAAETQEACIKHVSAMEISETQNNVMCSSADGKKQDAAKQVSKTQNERHVINVEEKQEEESCNKQVSALVIIETDDEDRVMSSAADTQEDDHKEDSAMEITETQNNEMCSAADGNKLDVGKEVSETPNERHVINVEEIQEEEACNKQVSAVVINETYDEDHTMSSAADTQEGGHEEHSAMEISETHVGGHVMSPAETQDKGACYKQVSVTDSNKTDNESRVMSCAADLQEVCNKNVSAKEITETHDENGVMSAAEMQGEENCNKLTSTMKITDIFNQSRGMSFAVVVEMDNKDENDMMSVAET